MAESWERWEGQVVNGEFPLGRYLGGSDHSVVFLTERGGQEPQSAAIKLIPVTADDPEIQLSWWELGAKLSHPHLLRLAQRGRCQLDDTELLYAVSEYAEENLAQILPQRPLTPAETLDVLHAVLGVLTYIHGKGFVHGHIKPSNIMAVGDQVKVSSDGLCGAGESSRVLGAAGTYTAPEIANGGGMTPASDIWSLGMAVVEAITQRLPAWDGTEQSEPIVPETLPAPFLEIARNCLRRQPEQRWTVPEIAARLQGVPSAPRRVQTGQPRKAAKSRYMVAAAAAGLLLLVILAPSVLKRHTDARPTPPLADSSKAEPSAEIVKGKEHPAGASASSPERATEARAQGTVAQQVMPDVSRGARNTIQGRIKVSVSVDVDSSGAVVAAKLVSRGPSEYFAKRALQAAQRWSFTPPQVEGQRLASEWIVRFEFARSGTNIHPTQTFP